MSLSDQLQSTEMDLAKAADLVLTTISILEEFRSDSQWNHIFKYVKDVADLHGISVDLPQPCRHKQLPKRLQDGVVLESTGREILQHPRFLNISRIHFIYQS